MEFGPVPLDRAEGAVLAHSVALPGGRLRKGRVLGAEDIAALRGAGLAEVVVARAGPGDLGEDAAAARLAAALAGPGPLRIGRAATGRVNLHATEPGLAMIDADAVARFNLVDPALTVATLPPLVRVAAGSLVATIKVIPYFAPLAAVEAAEAAGRGAIGVRPVTLRRAALIVTSLGDDAQAMKGAEAVARRVRRLGIEIGAPLVVPHEVPALTAAVARAEAELVLILTGSATSDAADTGPAALLAAGGRLERFGMPVDPGNLLFLGSLGPRQVIGLPGCARSPALNGADWVLERVACGLVPDAGEIAAMGVGGLLKESPARGRPRE